MSELNGLDAAESTVLTTANLDAIPLEGESLLELAAVPALLPIAVSAKSIRRWTETGVRGVVLETTCIGGRRFTSREAIRRLLAKINS